jgi:hypothetical protein
MKKPSPTTYKIGSLREFAEWTQRVVHDPASAHGVPKRWFDSAATARRAAANQVSAEAMVKLLSPGNLAVLDAIRRHRPASMHELAFHDGPRRTHIPALIARRVRLEIDLTGRHSSMAVAGLR